jgi:CDP-glycerol glycerophosphotransferase
VWFVRTTDVVQALDEVAAALEAQPDVLVVRHEIRGMLGQVRPGPADDARLHDKLFRRAFLQDIGARFGPSGASELTVTWPAVLRAERVETLDEVAYVRRRFGNAVREPRPARDVASQYRRVLAQAPRPRVMRALLRDVAPERPRRPRRRPRLDPDLAVFAAYWYSGYSCNPRAIYEKARELVPGFRGVWVVKPDAAETIPAGVEHVVARTPEYHDLLRRATYFVNNVNFPNHLVKRPGTVHVMTHHGTPLKRMGLDERRAAGQGLVKDFSALLRRCRRWDYSVAQNAFTTLYFERVYPLDYETLEVGYPRNDVLANATPEDVARARERLGVEPGRKAILYAPTYREYDHDAVPAADVLRLAEALPDDHVVLMRLHSFTGGAVEPGRVVDAAGARVEDACLAADALITDYSSIMFDYAVLDRPIVIHVPDWETYREMRGTTFDITAEAPGVVTRSAGELADAFTSGAAWGSAAPRAAFRERFCSLEDGRAAERVVRAVWG